MHRRAKTKNGTGRAKIGKLRLWIAAEKLDAQARLRTARDRLGKASTVSAEFGVGKMLGRLAVLGQVEAILAGNVSAQNKREAE